MKTAPIRHPFTRCAVRLLGASVLGATMVGCCSTGTPVAITAPSTVRTSQKAEDTVSVFNGHVPNNPGPHPIHILIDTKGAQITPDQVKVYLVNKHLLKVLVSTKDPFEPKLFDNTAR